MSKYILIFLALVSFVGARVENFEFRHNFILKKDQLAEIEIKKDYPKTFQNEGLLRFRWTLFHNKRLVLLVSYEGFKTQYILEPKYGRKSVKLFLTGDYKRIDKRPFVLMTFKSFDEKRKIAELETEFSDSEKRLEIKIKKPKK